MSYDGWWKDDQMCGHGKLSEGGIEFYRGEFFENQIMGEGRMFCRSENGLKNFFLSGTFIGIILYCRGRIACDTTAEVYFGVFCYTYFR